MSKVRCQYCGKAVDEKKTVRMHIQEYGGWLCAKTGHPQQTSLHSNYEIYICLKEYSIKKRKREKK